jgi:hypothetical protein
MKFMKGLKPAKTKTFFTTKNTKLHEIIPKCGGFNFPAEISFTARGCSVVAPSL